MGAAVGLRHLSDRGCKAIWFATAQSQTFGLSYGNSQIMTLREL